MGLPERVSINKNSPFYLHDIHMMWIYLNDVLVSGVVEANRPMGWLIKYETDDQNRLVRDAKGNPCLRLLRGRVEFKVKVFAHDHPKVFFSDYAQGSTRQE
jgi:hypothetical protein